MATDAKDAYQEGYDAYWAGARLSENPYPRESHEASSWHDGWYQAREEDCEPEEKD
jgi:ribosome modulation factor